MKDEHNYDYDYLCLFFPINLCLVAFEDLNKIKCDMKIHATK